jgi:hypothetical protein
MATEGMPDLMFTGTGQLLSVHEPAECVPPCPLHSPSEHRMATWPMNWRVDRQIMERICPHGIGHPDPDDHKVRSSWVEGVHGCDGCCAEEAPE